MNIEAPLSADNGEPERQANDAIRRILATSNVVQAPIAEGAAYLIREADGAIRTEEYHARGEE